MTKIPGIDISHWQDDKSTPQKMDFSKAVEQGAKYVFIKVSERGGIDRDFEYNWAAAKAAGLMRGGYHFLRWDLSGLVQARIFTTVMSDDPGELPPVADFEAPKRDGKYPSNSLLEQFLVETETRTGRVPMIYTSPGYWNVHGRNKVTKLIDQKWKYYPLWVAHYFEKYVEGVTKPMTVYPWGKDNWLFWQYSANGDGLAYGAESKSIDLNWFNGNLKALQDLAIGEQLGQPDQPDPDPGGPNIPDSELSLKIGRLENWARSMNYKG